MILTILIFENNTKELNQRTFNKLHRLTVEKSEIFFHTGKV